MDSFACATNAQMTWALLRSDNGRPDRSQSTGVRKVLHAARQLFLACRAIRTLPTAGSAMAQFSTPFAASARANGDGRIGGLSKSRSIFAKSNSSKTKLGAAIVLPSKAPPVF